jgi:putative oxidoreductase
MNIIHKLEKWGDSHHPRILDIIRVALGIFLILKGLAFMENTAGLKSIIENQTDIFLPTAVLLALVYYVTFVHLVGGTLIALGILTRLSALLQIPIVFGAVVFVNMLQSPLNTELWASFTCLVLLFIFVILGSGKLSLDNYLKDQDN